MTQRTILILVILLGFYLACSPGQGSKRPEWSGVIELEKGIEVVKNPAEPVFGDWTADLEEDLVLGSEEDENQQFFQVRALALDSRDNIYILDAGNKRIQQFDPRGRFINSFGKEGQGPGEFQNPSLLAFDASDNLYVTESRRIQAFDSSGKYLRSIGLEYPTFQFFLDMTGNIFTTAVISTEAGSRRFLLKLDPEGREIERLAEFTDVAPVTRRDDNGRAVTFKAYHQYNLWPQLCSVDQENFFFGWPETYRITRMNSDGRILRIIEKEESPQSISQAEKDQIVERIGEQFKRRGYNVPSKTLEQICEFPQYRPFYGNFFVDDAGRLFVLKTWSVLERPETRLFDVFSREGHYLCRAVLPFTPDYVRGSFLYHITTSDETGEVTIIRYRVLNREALEDAI